MLRLSKLTDYSTVIMSHMARRPWDVYSTASVAAAVGVAATTASKILKRLAQADLVQSVRGPKGGYRLSYPPQQISVAAVIDAMEGRFGLTECSARSGLCAQEAHCPSRDNWRRVNALVRAVLAGVTLADMSSATFAPPPGGVAVERRSRLERRIDGGAS